MPPKVLNGVCGAHPDTICDAVHERVSPIAQLRTKHGKPAVVVVDVAEYERLRRLERARAPSFADVLLAMPQDDGEFPRRNVRMRDLEL